MMNFKSLVAILALVCAIGIAATSANDANQGTTSTEVPAESSLATATSTTNRKGPPKIRRTIRVHESSPPPPAGVVVEAPAEGAPVAPVQPQPQLAQPQNIEMTNTGPTNQVEIKPTISIEQQPKQDKPAPVAAAPEVPVPSVDPKNASEAEHQEPVEPVKSQPQTIIVEPVEPQKAAPTPDTTKQTPSEPQQIQFVQLAPEPAVAEVQKPPQVQQPIVVVQQPEAHVDENKVRHLLVPVVSAEKKQADNKIELAESESGNQLNKLIAQSGNSVNQIMGNSNNHLMNLSENNNNVKQLKVENTGNTEEVQISGVGNSKVTKISNSGNSELVEQVDSNNVKANTEKAPQPAPVTQRLPTQPVAASPLVQINLNELNSESSRPATIVESLPLALESNYLQVQQPPASLYGPVLEASLAKTGDVVEQLSRGRSAFVPWTSRNPQLPAVRQVLSQFGAPFGGPMYNAGLPATIVTKNIGSEFIPDGRYPPMNPVIVQSPFWFQQQPAAPLNYPWTAPMVYPQWFNGIPSQWPMQMVPYGYPMPLMMPAPADNKEPEEKAESNKRKRNAKKHRKPKKKMATDEDGDKKEQEIEPKVEPKQVEPQQVVVTHVQEPQPPTKTVVIQRPSQVPQEVAPPQKVVEIHHHHGEPAKQTAPPTPTAETHSSSWLPTRLISSTLGSLTGQPARVAEIVSQPQAAVQEQPEEVIEYETIRIPKRRIVNGKTKA